MTQPSLFVTLVEARMEWDRTIRGGGGHCPCCDRFCKIYARRFNASMARALLWLHRRSGPQSAWVDVPRLAPKWLVRTNQLASARWWGLVERQTNADDPHIKHLGIWRTTGRGQAVCEGRLRIPSTVYTYNGEVQSFSEELVYLAACFRTPFDYQEVLAGLALEGRDAG